MNQRVQRVIWNIGDCRTSCTSVNCFCQKFCHFPSWRDTFYFPKSVPPWLFLTSVSESLKDIDGITNESFESNYTNFRKEFRKRCVSCENTNTDVIFCTMKWSDWSKARKCCRKVLLKNLLLFCCDFFRSYVALLLSFSFHASTMVILVR